MSTESPRVGAEEMLYARLVFTPSTVRKSVRNWPARNGKSGLSVGTRRRVVVEGVSSIISATSTRRRSGCRPSTSLWTMPGSRSRSSAMARAWTFFPMTRPIAAKSAMESPRSLRAKPGLLSLDAGGTPALQTMPARRRRYAFIRRRVQRPRPGARAPKPPGGGRRRYGRPHLERLDERHCRQPGHSGARRLLRWQVGGARLGGRQRPVGGLVLRGREHGARLRDLGAGAEPGRVHGEGVPQLHDRYRGRRRPDLDARSPPKADGERRSGSPRLVERLDPRPRGPSGRLRAGHVRAALTPPAQHTF